MNNQNFAALVSDVTTWAREGGVLPFISKMAAEELLLVFQDERRRYHRDRSLGCVSRVEYTRIRYELKKILRG